MKYCECCGLFENDCVCGHNTIRSDWSWVSDDNDTNTEAVDLLSRVQRVMHSNVMTPRSMDVVFKRLSFAIQKEVAVQVVARLPTISM
ncbi:hypothetical protein Hanom_Chr06g00504581 [Helianthus anomalus]